MFKVEVEFSSRDDNMGNPQWWEYTILARDGFDGSWHMSSNNSGALGEMMVSDLSYINELYWRERQLPLF